MGINRALIFISLLALLALPASAARPIIADLALRGIEIDANFTGINILLFGARDEAGDVVVVVRGPQRNYTVRKKERVAGIWINRAQERLDDVNSFYALASSRPLSKIDNDYLLTALGIKADGFGWRAGKAERFGKNDEFSKALYEIKQSQGLYPIEIGKISFWGETLFRTNIWFPANIEGGTYLAEVYLLSDGQLVSVQSTPIHVKKIGFEAFTYEFAHKRSALYGALSILLAVFGGWLASVIFRKV